VSAVTARFRARMADPEADHPANPIHSGSGARAHGFSAALVGGATVYGWCVAAIVDALGEGWLSHGWADVEFKRPVYPDEWLEARVDADGALSVQGNAGDARLRGRVGLGTSFVDHRNATDIAPRPALAQRPRLTPQNVPVGRDLRARALTLAREESERFCREHQHETRPCFFGPRALAHPAWIASQPIHLLHHSFDYGPAIHTASRIQHLNAISVDVPLVISGTCVEAFARKDNEYIVNDVTIAAEGGEPLARIRHTAIYQLATRIPGEQR
jgi:hypothetical protein